MVRISGLASGMDIDSIVSDMMKIKRIPLNKLNQKKQLLEWQRDDYREINTLLSSFDRFLFDKVILQRDFLANKAVSSNENAVSVVARSYNANVVNQIEVNQLATPASWKAGSDIKTKDAFPNSYFDEDFTVNKSGTFTFKVKEPGAEEYKEVKLSISEGDTLDTVLSKINNSDLGISAMRLNIAGEGERIVFTAKKTGSDGEFIAVQGDGTGYFLRSLGFNLPTVEDISEGDPPEVYKGYKLAPSIAGTDAEVKINDFTTLQKSNTFTLNGVEYTLKNKTDSPVNVFTTTDVDAIFNNIKTFIDKYNEIVEKIQGKLNEERYRSYHPLSDEEKEAMTDKQVEKWEERARSGLLRNDTLLSRILGSMRMDMYATVETGDIFTHLSQIGITTSNLYREGGKLVIDENKLKEAISKDPAAVHKLFSSNEENGKGLAQRLRDSVNQATKLLVEKAGNSSKTNNQFTIGKLLNTVNSQIDRYERRMLELEDRYYRQFSAMEKMIQQANSQSVSLMQYFS